MKKLRSVYLLIICAVLVFSMFSCTASEADTKKAETIKNEDGAVVPSGEKVYNFSENKAGLELKNIDDARKIIAKAQEMYREYDKFIFADNEIRTAVAIPDITVKTVEEADDIYDDKFSDYFNYLGTTGRISIELFEKILPENAVLNMDEMHTNFPYPNYYFVEYEKFGFTDWYDAYKKVIIDDTCIPKEVGDYIYCTGDRIHYYDFETKEDIILWPTEKELEISKAINDARIAAGQDPNYHAIEESNSARFEMSFSP